MADEKTPDHASAHEEELIRAKEAERLKKYIKDNAYTIALAIDGSNIPPRTFLHMSMIWD